MLDILIIEPNPQLVTPYSLLTGIYHRPLSLSRVDSLADARKSFDELHPSIVLMSCSFAANDALDMLEYIRLHMIGEIIPLIWVVDLCQPLSQVLGTAWGGKVAVLSSVADIREVRGCFYHLLNQTEVVEAPPPAITETIPDDDEVTSPLE